MLLWSLRLRRMVQWLGIIIPVSFLLLCTGCATSSTAGVKTGEGTSELPVGEFQDIPIAPGMVRDEKRMVQVETGQFQTGIGVYKGRVEVRSLADYYKGIMPTRGWKLLADFAAKRTVQVYTKEQRVSVILIEEGFYYTHLEIFVGTSVPGTVRSSP